MNLTLRDLLRWPDTSLRLDSGSAADTGAAPPPLDRPIAWPVSMRATPPLLPHLEAGALVLVPASVLAAASESLPAALRELLRHDIAALVVGVDAGIDAGALTLLRSAVPVGPELEAALARRLRERRADLYHRAAELDRALAEAAPRAGDIHRLMVVGAAWSGRDIVLLDGDGAVVSGAPRDRASPPALPNTLTPGLVERGAEEWYFAAVNADRRWVAIGGPLGALNEYDRLVADRLAAALARQVDAEPDARPDGLAASDAAEPRVLELVAPGLEARERRERALAFGIDPEAWFALIAQYTTAKEDAAPVLGLAGRGGRVGMAPFLDADASRSGWLLHARDTAELRVALADLAHCAATAPVEPTGVSEIVRLDALPDAWRQACFAHEIARRQLAPGPVASWNQFDDLGAHRLLYPWWRTPAAEHFVTAVLGDLPAHDRRHGGVLLPTLRAYLAHGGNAASAAQALAIHRNTLSYRLRRVADLTGRSPLDGRQQLALRLATLLDLLGSTTPDDR